MCINRRGTKKHGSRVRKVNKMIYKRSVNYYETDGMRIVHHSNYIRYLEEARCAFLKQIGLPYDKIEEMGFMIPVLEVNCKYKMPAKFGTVMNIEVKIKQFDGIKLTIGYIVTEEKTNNIIVQAETKHCFTNQNMKPISLKKENKEIYETLLKYQEQVEK